MSKVPREKKITVTQIQAMAVVNGIEPAALQAFVEVEGSGIGFSDYTGRMLIQFEPHWMKRFLTGKGKTPSGTWLNNGVKNQTLEYIAFEDACKQDREAAMKSTSVGMMQVMGFHYRSLGFATVSDMWSFADASEKNQLELGIRFIKANPALYKALKEKNWHLVAYYYNGSGYKALAKRLGSVPYDVRFANAYKKYKAKISSPQTTTTVNIRTGAGTQFPLAGSPLRVNTAVDIIRTQAGWSRVRVLATALEGWVSSKYIAA